MSETLGETGLEPATTAAPEPASVADALANGTAAGAVADPEPAPAATEAASQIDPRELQAELDHMRQQYELLAQHVQTQVPQPQAGQQFDPSQLVDEYGQINPAALAQFLDARNTALLAQIDERFQQVSEPLAAQAMAQREQQYADMVDGMVSDHAADLSPKGRDLLEARALQILPDLNQRFGTNPDGTTKPNVLEMAIQRASADVRDALGTATSTGQQETAARLAQLAGASGEPGTGATAAAGGATQFTSPRQVTEHYAAQARLAQNNGN
jgi:hypothetical protein